MRRLAITLAIPMILIGSVEVYNVDVYQNCNAKADRINGVQQEVVMTCDSVVALYAFNGAPVPGNYHIQIVGIPNAEVTVKDSLGWRWIGGELQNPVKVTRGKKYTLKFYHESDSVNFYYNPNNPYPHGQLTNPNMPDYDLCARVWGRNDTSGGYFGLSGLSGLSCFSGLT